MQINEKNNKPRGESMLENRITERRKKTPFFRKIPVVIITTALLTSSATFGTVKLLSLNSAPVLTLAAKTSGGVVLTESELISTVKELNQVIYWAGPMPAAKYTLNLSSPGIAYVRYLPKGQGLTDTKPLYRVIGTYQQTNAYEATTAAGNQTNGVALLKSNGSVIYYNKTTPTNIYLATKGADQQIEVFDPNPTTALELANAAGLVAPIK